MPLRGVYVRHVVPNGLEMTDMWHEDTTLLSLVSSVSMGHRLRLFNNV